MTAVCEMAPRALEDLSPYEQAYAELYREHPLAEGPDVGTMLSRIFSDPRVQGEFR